jgi:hypothetical protein
MRDETVEVLLWHLASRTWPRHFVRVLGTWTNYALTLLYRIETGMKLAILSKNLGILLKNRAKHIMHSSGCISRRHCKHVMMQYQAQQS